MYIPAVSSPSKGQGSRLTSSHTFTGTGDAHGALSGGTERGPGRPDKPGQTGLGAWPEPFYTSTCGGRGLVRSLLWSSLWSSPPLNATSQAQSPKLASSRCIWFNGLGMYSTYLSHCEHWPFLLPNDHDRPIDPADCGWAAGMRRRSPMNALPLFLRSAVTLAIVTLLRTSAWHCCIR